MPSEFQRDRSKMLFMTSVNSEIDYRDSLSERATAVGDIMLMKDAPVVYNGVPLLGVPIAPENLGGGSDQTEIVYADPKNIQVGLWRKVRIETDKDVSAGVFIVVATLRFDCKLAEETAAVKIQNVLVS